MDKRYYYIGEGVFHHKGKDYGYGEVLPADVPEVSIESMLTKKKVSETKPAGTAGAGTADDNAPLRDEVKQLRAQNSLLMEDLGKAKDYYEKLEGELKTATEKGEASEEDLKRCVQAFNQAEAEVTRLQGELEGARATITEKDSTIKSLTDQLMNAGKGKQK